MSEALSREEFIALAKGMKAVYTQPTFLPDMSAVEVWYQLLNDIPYPLLNSAIQAYMKINESSFPPSPASLRKYATRGTEAGDESKALEEWGCVRKALRNSIYGYEEEFEKLPETAKRTIGSPSILKDWAQLEVEEVDTVIQSNFLRSWRATRRAVDEEIRLNPNISTLIEKTLSNTPYNALEGNQ